jgi:pimeloyl-ACP methyl ester carboxylesterase
MSRAMSGRDLVLLLHGQPGAARDWEGVLQRLPEGVRAVAIDRPGWNGAGTAGDLRENARAALAALDAAQAPRATVVGHSFGGAVAAWLAAHHPERVGALVLAAPAATRDSLDRLDHLLATPIAGYLASTSLMAGVGVTLSAPLVRRAIGAQLRLDQRFLRDAARTMRRPGSWGSFAVEQRALVRQLPELEQSLGAIRAPTTIVIGTRDRIVSPSSARTLARRLPGATLVELAGASHLLAYEQPLRLAELIVASANDRLRR